MLVEQGFKHFSLMHARWSGHSGSVVHSGFGAVGKYVTCNQYDNIQLCHLIPEKLCMPHDNMQNDFHGY